MATRPQDLSAQFAKPAWTPVLDAPVVLARAGVYEARLAQTEAEVDELCRLRFRVFNLELHEGLQSAYATGRDRDEFDEICDHVMVVNAHSGDVVGTYRMQTGITAAEHLGYYSEQEFNFAPYEALREQVLELGRACVHPDHRSFDVLMVLWRGVAAYATMCGSRYLIGCSSVTTQDPVIGSALYHTLKPYQVTEPWRTRPTPSFAFEIHEATGIACKPPKLLRTYLTIGAKICGSPALDREFGTIDFLTLLDLEDLAPTMKARLFGA